MTEVHSKEWYDFYRVRSVAIGKLPPPPHPELGYCFFCENHPYAPRKVQAVTRTKDGTPRMTRADYKEWYEAKQ